MATVEDAPDEAEEEADNGHDEDGAEAVPENERLVDDAEIVRPAPGELGLEDVEDGLGRPRCTAGEMAVAVGALDFTTSVEMLRPEEQHHAHQPRTLGQGERWH